ncbi:MAG: tetratricopeptide repeat protein [Urechidicola sp.]|nr:tetratricopeptide repeat protein [Urechidicola sp.]
MQKIIIFLFFFCSTFLYAQDQQLVYDYFRKGEYEKSATIYQKLYEQNNYNSSYLSRLLYCHQQLENFDESKILIENHISKYPSQIQFYVELGYNYELQHQQTKADYYYTEAINTLKEKPVYGYTIGRTFQKNHLLDYALQAYKITMESNPNANYEIQVAEIYGEKGELQNMFNSYLNMVEKDQRYVTTILRYIGKYITDDAENEYNILFRKLILKRLQVNPNNSWNQLLSWLFMQQKDYGKAFVQEKAMYKRTDSLGLNGIVDLGQLAFNDKDYSATKVVFSFVLENAESQNQIIDSKLYLLFVDIETSDNPEEVDTQFQNLFNEYGKTSATINIQIAYADFLTFKKQESYKAIDILKEALKLRSTDFQKGAIKLKLGDILVFNNQFNQALINYSQVQTSLKNHILGQEAQFKVAKTSFYKGDFDWAETQLKVLKGSTSQLIANDALELSLIISDNTVQDSLKTALKLYAQSDLLAYQGKNTSAIDSLNVLLNKFKGHAIEDEALFKQAKIFEKLNQYDNAEKNYLRIIEINPTDILVDDAFYRMGELHSKQNNIEKAKEYYQKIIFDFPSSIHLVDARKKYRKLRGDDIQ